MGSQVSKIYILRCKASWRGKFPNQIFVFEKGKKPFLRGCISFKSIIRWGNRVISQKKGKSRGRRGRTGIRGEKRISLSIRTTPSPFPFSKNFIALSLSFLPFSRIQTNSRLFYPQSSLKGGKGGLFWALKWPFQTRDSPIFFKKNLFWRKNVN